MTDLYYLGLLVLAVGGILWWADRREDRQQKQDEIDARTELLKVIAEEQAQRRPPIVLEDGPSRLERLRAVTQKEVR